MAKKATVNGFNGGLSMDLNELTNTKEVLTDAVNATLVTGNGDEMLLQNAMGNSYVTGMPVEDALDKTGQVPINAVERSGVAYIASYSPSTKKCQIGTFPSPQGPRITIHINDGDGENTGTQCFITRDIDITEETRDLNITHDCTADEDYDIKIRQGDIITAVIDGDPSYITTGDEKNLYYLDWYVLGENMLKRHIQPKYTVSDSSILCEVPNYTGITGDLCLSVLPYEISFDSFAVMVKADELQEVRTELAGKDQYVQLLSLLSNVTGNCIILFNTYKDSYPKKALNGLLITVDGKQYTDRDCGDFTVITTDRESISGMKAELYAYNKLQKTVEYPDITTDRSHDFSVYMWKYYWSEDRKELNVGVQDNRLFTRIQGSSPKITFSNFSNINKNVYSLYIHCEKYTPASGVYTFSTSDNTLNDSLLSDYNIYLCHIFDGEYRWFITNNQYNGIYDTEMDFGKLSDYSKYTQLNYKDVDTGDSELKVTSKTHFDGNPLIGSNLSGDCESIIKDTVSLEYPWNLTLSTDNGLFTVINTQVGDVSVTAERDGTTDPDFHFTSSGYDKDKRIVQFGFDVSNTVIGRYKTFTGLQMSKYLRPFVMDPTQVSQELREKLKSNYYAFGYELKSDYLPLHYFMDQLYVNPGRSTHYTRWMVDRTNISRFDPRYQEDSPATISDVGAAYEQITDTVSESVLQDTGINTIMSEYADAFENSYKVSETDTISIKKENNSFKINKTLGIVSAVLFDPAIALGNVLTFGLVNKWFNKPKVRQTYDTTFKHTKDNNITKASDFDLFPYYSLRYNNSDIIPSFMFWGSWNMIDGLTERDNDKYGRDAGILIDPDGEPEETSSKTRYSSGPTWTGDAHSPKALVPFWMNNNLSYSTVNIAYVDDADGRTGNETSEQGTVDNAQGFVYPNTMSEVIKALIKTYKNEYVLTDGDVEMSSNDFTHGESIGCITDAVYKEPPTYDIDCKIHVNGAVTKFSTSDGRDLSMLLYNGTAMFSLLEQLNGIDVNKDQIAYKVNDSDVDIHVEYTQQSPKYYLDMFNTSDKNILSTSWPVLLYPKEGAERTALTQIKDGQKSNITVGDSETWGSEVADMTVYQIDKPSTVTPYFMDSTNEMFNDHTVYEYNTMMEAVNNLGTGITEPPVTTPMEYLEAIPVSTANDSYSMVVLRTAPKETGSVWTTDGGYLVPNRTQADRQAFYDRFGQKVAIAGSWARSVYTYININIAAYNDIIKSLPVTDSDLEGDMYEDGNKSDSEYIRQYRNLFNKFHGSNTDIINLLGTGEKLRLYNT